MDTSIDSKIELSPAQIARYSRHVMLPQVGLEGQKKLEAGSALVIGMGGLGSPVALYLAAAGVGTLGLADFDVIEEHNLQRQIIHRTDRVGTPKLDSALEELRNLNPHMTLREHREGVTIDNALNVFSKYDIIVDGSDNFPTRYLVNDAAYFAERPLVYGSIFQFEGQVSLFHSKAGGPCYRCLFPSMPALGTVPNCAEAGVFGALCGVIGSMQAMEAIKHLVAIGDSLMGRLLVIDALSMKLRELNLKRDPECPLCGQNPQIHSLEAENYNFDCEVDSEEATDEETVGDYPMEVSIEDAKALLDTNESAYLLDVREPFEVAICAIQGSVNIPMQQIAENIGALPRDGKILVHCHHGGRSLQVTKYLRAKGFEAVSNVAGGIDAWAVRIDPEMKRY